MNIPSLRKSDASALLGSISLLLSSGVAFSQTQWNTSSGEWLDAANWSAGVPGASVAARFGSLSGGVNEMEVTVGSGVAKNATAQALQVLFGTSVEMEMAAGSSLVATSPLWRIGFDPANPNTSPNAASSLTISGPSTGSASVSMGQFFVGASDGNDPTGSPAGGHRLTFSGSNLVVSTSGTPTSIVGRFGNNNRFEVLGGARVSLNNLDVSANNAGAGKSGNSVVVSGNDSSLSVQGSFRVGDRAATRSNFAEVGGHTPSAPENRAVLRASTLSIGGENGSNFGGNRLRVKAHGTLETAGTTAIQTYNVNGGNNDGMNRLEIASEGIFSAGGHISNNGLLALHDGGVLEGRNPDTRLPVAVNLIIEPTGRFEAEGAGLAANVTTLIQNSRLAVGVTPESGSRTAGAALTLQSEMRFHSTVGGALEMTWFSDGSYDQVIFSEGGLFTGGEIRLDLKLGTGAAPLAGAEWQLFSGEVSGMSAPFNLAGIDRDIWDVSSFNQVGGWKLVAIPEPGTLGLIGAGMIFLTIKRRRR